MFFIFLVPGFVSIKSWTLFHPTKDIKSKDYVFEIICYGILNYFVFYKLIVFNLTNESWWAYFVWVIILLIVPFFWPLIFKKIFSFRFISKRILHTMPTAWDYFFSKRESSFALIHLKNGKKIGGIYIGKSYASGFPHEKDIYLSKEWKVAESGKFIEMVKNTKGLYISMNSVEYIEFFKLNKKNND